MQTHNSHGETTTWAMSTHERGPNKPHEYSRHNQHSLAHTAHSRRVQRHAHTRHTQGTASHRKRVHHQRLQIQRHQDPTPQQTRSYTSDATDDVDFLPVPSGWAAQQQSTAVVCLMCKCSFSSFFHVFFVCSALTSASNLQDTTRNQPPRPSVPTVPSSSPFTSHPRRLPQRRGRRSEEGRGGARTAARGLWCLALLYSSCIMS